MQRLFSVEDSTERKMPLLGKEKNLSKSIEALKTVHSTFYIFFHPFLSEKRFREASFICSFFSKKAPKIFYILSLVLLYRVNEVMTFLLRFLIKTLKIRKRKWWSSFKGRQMSSCFRWNLLPLEFISMRQFLTYTLCIGEKKDLIYI